MQLFNTRELIHPDPTHPEGENGVMIRLVPGDARADIEIARAPDSGGSPGTFVTVARLGPIPRSGGYYFDPLPSNGATWWYKSRHVGYGKSPSSYTTAFSTAGEQLDEPVRLAYVDVPAVYTRTADLADAAVTTAKVADAAVTTGKLVYSGASISISNPFFDAAADEVDLTWSASGMPSGTQYNVSIWQEGADGIYKTEDNKTSVHTFTGITGTTGRGTVQVDAVKDGILLVTQRRSGTWTT